MLLVWLSPLRTTKKRLESPSTDGWGGGGGLWPGQRKKSNFNSSAHLHGCKGPTQCIHQKHTYKRRLQLSPLFLHAIAPISKSFGENVRATGAEADKKLGAEFANKQTQGTAASTTIRPLFSAAAASLGAAALTSSERPHQDNGPQALRKARHETKRSGTLNNNNVHAQPGSCANPLIKIYSSCARPNSLSE